MPDRLGDKIRLQHVVDAINTIEEYVKDADFDVFNSNSMMRDACIRQLQVIGESCRSITAELRTKYPDIPWRQIIGLRIIVIHEYFGIDERVIWEIIKNDLPPFKSQVEKIISDLE